MTLSWVQYNSIYYLIQYGLFIAIYFFVVIFIPFDLMGWIAETVLFLKDDDKRSKKTQTGTDVKTDTEDDDDKPGKSPSTSTDVKTHTEDDDCIWNPCDGQIDRNERQNGCCCCYCLWVPLKDTKLSEREYGFPGGWFCISLDDEQKLPPQWWRRWNCISWLFKNRKPESDKKTKTKTKTNTNTDTPPWCTCSYIWEFFGKVCKCRCRCCTHCKCCTCCGCCTHCEGCTCCGCCTHCEGCTCCGCNLTPKDCDNCLINLSYCCCECYFGDEDSLKNKKLPHHHHLILQITDESKYCGCIYLNLKRIGVYLLVCLSLWCGTVAFFEGIILGYTTAQNGDSCPTPKRGTPTTIVDCFIFQNPWDISPINTSFPTECNSSMTISFTGHSASCFAWIYANVGVDDVIEELGICAGIVALFGSVIAIMSYLCRHHRWRLIFDIIAVLSVAGILILNYTKGDVPFITYILLGSLCAAVAITEYLLDYVPLLTWLCVANRFFRCIKDRRESITSIRVTSRDSDSI